MKKIIFLTPALIFVCLIFFNNLCAYEIIGKVIDTYVQRDVTHCTLEVKKTLVSGSSISLYNGVSVIVGEQLDERDGLYYYSASAIGKPKIHPGTDVFNEEVKEFIRGKEAFIKIEKRSTFVPKKYGEVTAVQNKRVLIDRGSLHAVREKDIYSVYDSSGKYKGMVELYGIGDFQSSGKAYHTLEDLDKRTEVEPGDKVKYLGQRKLYGLGFMFGSHYPAYRSGAESIGGGLLWTMTFSDGWGGEFLMGGSYESWEHATEKRINGVSRSSQGLGDLPISTTLKEGERYSVLTAGPLMIRKNFFYPRSISPFLACGVSYMQIKYEANKIVPNPDPLGSFSEIQLAATPPVLQTIAPVFGTGLDVFPVKLFRIRLDVKYLLSPDVETELGNFSTKGWQYSLAFITGW